MIRSVVFLVNLEWFKKSQVEALGGESGGGVGLDEVKAEACGVSAPYRTGGAIDGVKLRGGTLVFIHVGPPPSRAELRLLEEPQTEVSVAGVVVGIIVGVGDAHCLNLKPWNSAIIWWKKKKPKPFSSI
ncbi:hypothetical protein FF1_034686 [Malus domestica]